MQIKSKIFNKIVYWGRVIVLGIVLGVSIQIVYAWTGPTSAPPGGNVSGPLTVGTGIQTKAGKLQTASTVDTDPGTTLVTKDYALNVGTGIQTKAGKLQTASTVATDPATTLVTKNYVDAAASTYIRGGQYGWCKQELDASFVVTVASSAYYPVLTCPGPGSSPTAGQPTCASGFALMKLFVSQMNGGANGVDPVNGHSKMDDRLDSYSRGSACVKL